MKPRYSPGTRTPAAVPCWTNSCSSWASSGFSHQAPSVTGSIPGRRRGTTLMGRDSASRHLGASWKSGSNSSLRSSRVASSCVSSTRRISLRVRSNSSGTLPASLNSNACSTVRRLALDGSRLVLGARQRDSSRSKSGVLMRYQPSASSSVTVSYRYRLQSKWEHPHASSCASRNPSTRDRILAGLLPGSEGPGQDPGEGCRTDSQPSPEHERHPPGNISHCPHDHGQDAHDADQRGASQQGRNRPRNDLA